jgi:hypothetical protein
MVNSLPSVKTADIHGRLFRSVRPYIRPALVVVAIAVVSAVAFGTERYLSWRHRMIEWDAVSIQEMFGGTAEGDRISQIKFIREWEYEAFKQTSDGKGVWLRVVLSKRYCGNWMLVDQTQRDLIRPFHLRYPHGLPHRPGAVWCGGISASHGE